MKIIQLDVEGFRSLKKISWKPGDLNVVIGPNGTGKSNLLRVLELMSLSAQGGLGKYIQASGGVEPLVWDGEADQIDISLKASRLESDKYSPYNDLTYKMSIGRVGKGSSYRIDKELLGDYSRVEKNLQQEPFKHLERSGVRSRIFNEESRALVLPDESVMDEESLLSIVSGPLTNTTNWRIPFFQKQLAEWRLYHDLNTTQGAAIRQAPVARHATRVESNGENLVQVLHTLYTNDREFKRSLNSAMRAAFGNDFEELVFPPASDQRVQMRIRWRTLRREQSSSDLSDGTLRFLFLIAVLVSPNPAPLIAIDEPETGLHPSMLPIISEYAVEASQKAQVIFTTHSAELLSAFGEKKPSVTVANWEDGETKLKTISGDSLDYWLQDYSLGTLYRSGQLEELE